jgi:hypothetical protein
LIIPIRSTSKRKTKIRRRKRGALMKEEVVKLMKAREREREREREKQRRLKRLPLNLMPFDFELC